MCSKSKRYLRLVFDNCFFMCSRRQASASVSLMNHSGFRSFLSFAASSMPSLYVFTISSLLGTGIFSISFARTIALRTSFFMDVMSLFFVINLTIIFQTHKAYIEHKNSFSCD